jgi:uncharacterized protein YdbL (DUF1318 family)
MRQLIRALGLGAALVLIALPAMGNSLDDAKAAGKLGEGHDGYLHVVSSDAGAEAEALAKSINDKRKVKYQSIATKRGIPLAAVANQAGAKLVGSAPAGQYVLRASGEWTKK